MIFLKLKVLSFIWGEVYVKRKNTFGIVVFLVIAFSIVVIYFKMEYITRKELKVIILKDLSTKKENLNNYKVKFLKDGETYIYKINFKYENNEYHYEVNAKNGYILLSDKVSEIWQLKLTCARIMRTWGGNMEKEILNRYLPSDLELKF